MLVWLKANGHAAIAALGDQYAHSNPFGVTQLLPGPTGERNTLAFVSRGRVLCLANDLACLLNQICASLATGNKAVISADQLAKLPANLPAEVKAQLIEAEYHQAEAQIALVQTDLAQQYRQELAALDGAIVSIIPASASQPLPLWRLVAERALCVNTTAAGGNASLMTLAV